MGGMDASLRARAEAWLAEDPDPDTRDELKQLLDSGDEEALAARFAGRLEFGTAGLRGEIGAGPMRMNRVIVRRAAAGLVQYLIDTVPNALARGLVIGYDARRKSDVFALDTALVAAGRGMRALLISHTVPTPVLAFAVTHVGAAAGVMVTASHNPPADNGYKVYLGDGAQIVPPHDHEISARIDAVTSLAAVTLAAPDDARIEHIDRAVIDAYLAHVPMVRLVHSARDVVVAYTPMHGVGRDVAMAAFACADLPRPWIVGAQADPDPTFPTVSFPNPEEPGAMDLVLAEADRVRADLAIANDPDADRLGVAVPLPDGGWRKLRGDEIGWLFADHILRYTEGDDRLVVTTLVSSILLSRMAAAAHVHYAETFTGFKWIARAIAEHPDYRFVFGYEQALGYLVTDRPRDKDGITAAVLMAEIAALAKHEQTTLLERLDDIAARFGRHVTAERSIRVPVESMAAFMDRLRAAPPTELASEKVTEVTDFVEANLLRFTLGDSTRVQVRPSGTEPKVKIYAEAVDRDPEPLIDALVALATREA
jgi:phosphomannomutase